MTIIAKAAALMAPVLMSCGPPAEKAGIGFIKGYSW
jgi:hypothetical protein